MTRLDTSEIERLKLSVSLERLVDACGMALQAHSNVPRAVASGSADAIPDTGEPFTQDPCFVLLTQLGNDGGQDQSMDHHGKG